MKRLSRDVWLGIGLLIALVALTAAAAVQQTRNEQAPPLASFSSQPDGARALWLWLDEIGYAVSDEAGASFAVPDETAFALLLEPFPVAQDEWDRLDEWVDEGGALLVAGERYGAALAAAHFEFNLRVLSEPRSSLSPQAPLLLSPPLTVPADAQVRACYDSERDDFVAYFAVDGCPVVVAFTQGAGRVILSSAPFPFSNAGLKAEGNPALALNLLPAALPAGRVWFDEWHHGQRGAVTEVTGPGDWLRRTPAGRSLLFVGAVVFAALVVNGRRFGRPVPLPRETARRAPLEYVTAIANLNRRAGHRASALRCYHDSLKRALGHRYRLDPRLPDEEYVDWLAACDPDLDRAALAALLARLSRPGVSEKDMVSLAGEAAEWMERK